MSKRKQRRTRKTRMIFGGMGLFIVVAAGLMVWRLYLRQPTYPIGAATYCQQRPHFIAEMPQDTQSVMGTAITGVLGLAIFNPTTGEVTQHDTWDDAGNLGPYTYDEDGHMYLAPVPFVSLIENPPDEQNKIYRVDTDTGIMSEWIDLLPARPPSTSNPFGVVGLGYDCDTQSLYAASLMGSTPDEEVGYIYRIDVESGTLADQLDGFDAMGVGVFNGVQGKRLYFGSARDNAVRSIALDRKGNFNGEPRLEFYLSDLAGGGYERVQGITFTPENQMILKGVEFNYTLHATSETSKTLYTLSYNLENDSWELMRVTHPSQ